MISMIVAVSKNNIIGFKNSLPWKRIPEDMQWFREKTYNNVVIMGRKTFESLNQIPLKNRINVVVSSIPIDGVDTISDLLEENIKAYQIGYPDKEIFIIGGAQLYESTQPFIDRVYLTRIHERVEGDTILNIDAILSNTNIIDSKTITSETGQIISFETFNKVKHE
jgi:dihydrofolate reductase